MDECRLEAKALVFGRENRAILQGVSFAVVGGQLALITGPNGAGKTSLIKILCGMLIPDSGQILWRQSATDSIAAADSKSAVDGMADIRRDAAAYREQIAYLGHKDGVKGDLTPAENLTFAARLVGIAADVGALLEKWGLRGADAPCRTLSAGQRRRCALARLSLAPARLWLLDEPLTALDESGRRLLGDSVAEFLRGGGAAVMSTHRIPDWHLNPQTIAL